MRESFSRSALIGASLVAALSGCYGFASTSGRHTLPTGLTTPVTGTPPGGGALAPVGTSAPTARLYADVDRSGKIDGNDDANRDQWSGTRGAIFVLNMDDDDTDKKVDSADNKTNGAEDLRTLSRLVVGQLSSNPLTVKLTYTPATAPVRVFKHNSSSGQLSEVIGPGQGSTGTIIPNNEIVGGEVNFFIEGSAPRTGSFDGLVTFTLDVAGSQGSQDTVKFMLAPLIWTDNTRPAITVRAMPLQGVNAPFISALQTGLTAQGLTFIPVSEQTYQGDRWVQDDLQTGFTGYVDGNGNYVYVELYNSLDRGRGLEKLVEQDILNKNKGRVFAGSTNQFSINYGGNLEVVPPFNGYPFGRIYHGGGDQGTVTGQPVSLHMNALQVAMMNAQGMQGPTIEISSEWLAVGHVDEFSMAIPDLNSTGGRAWKIAWASPTLAYAALTALKNKGMGSAVVFAGRTGTQPATTVDAILNNAQQMQFNQQVIARLDQNKQKLMTECGLTAADFIDFPIFFEILPGAGTDDGVARNPGSANGIPCTDRMYIPDPEGPDDNGKDVWQAQIDAALAPLGLQPVYVDVFESYHTQLGEAHCGSMTFYTPYTTPWWTR
ncbi:MAG: protein-arginine deiminase family protein [Planctomycetota bacterium]